MKWYDIPGWEDYSIDKKGKVRSKERTKFVETKNGLSYKRRSKAKILSLPKSGSYTLYNGSYSRKYSKEALLYLAFPKEYQHLTGNKVQKWLPIPGYEGLYEISENKDIRRLAQEVEKINKNGELVLGIIRGENKKPRKDGSITLNHPTCGPVLLNIDFIHKCVWNPSTFVLPSGDNLKKVSQYNPFGVCFKIWKSVSHASLGTCIEKHLILKSCNPKSQLVLAGGFIWKY